jgi:hypothetical protein
MVIIFILSMIVINLFLDSDSKYGFTVELTAQEYTLIPKTITRNMNYFTPNKKNDNVSIDRIIKNQNLCG